jgi:hypothetical protein
MFQQPRGLKRSIVAGLAVCALAPAGAAAATPTIVGSGVAAGGGPGVSAQDFPQQQTRPAVRGSLPPHASPIAASSDDGVDTVAWIFIGGAALLTTGGLGVVTVKRARLERQGQTA